MHSTVTLTGHLLTTHLHDSPCELGWDLLNAGCEAGGRLLGEHSDGGDELLLGGEGLASLELWVRKSSTVCGKQGSVVRGYSPKSQGYGVVAPNFRLERKGVCEICCVWNHWEDQVDRKGTSR